MKAIADALRNRGDMARIAEISGVDQSTISRIVSGVTKRPSYETVVAIQKAIRERDKEIEAEKKAKVSA